MPIAAQKSRKQSVTHTFEQQIHIFFQLNHFHYFARKISAVTVAYDGTVAMLQNYFLVYSEWTEIVRIPFEYQILGS